jgi:hypothetical protein
MSKSERETAAFWDDKSNLELCQLEIGWIALLRCNQRIITGATKGDWDQRWSGYSAGQLPDILWPSSAFEPGTVVGHPPDSLYRPR